MQIRFIVAVCFVLFWEEAVSADTDNEAKRGNFPFMAFIYYPDETIVDTSGARFIRAGVIIKPHWLISSAIDHGDQDGVPMGFPRKTLLARAGAIQIDANLTLNEDEEEQEREIVQIVRPRHHNVEVWWKMDITVLKTLLPFKVTSAVAPYNLNSLKRDADKNCFFLAYSKKANNATDYKLLVKLPVDLLPPSMDNCGGQFNDGSMTCGIDTDESINALYDPDFCVGNAGGPLLCEGVTLALQTYIENNCKQPHLYTLLNPWLDFINCAVEEHCDITDKVCNMCVANFKDNNSEVTSRIPSSRPPDLEATQSQYVPSRAELQKQPEETMEKLSEEKTEKVSEEKVEKQPEEKMEKQQSEEKLDRPSENMDNAPATSSEPTTERVETTMGEIETTVSFSSEMTTKILNSTVNSTLRPTTTTLMPSRPSTESSTTTLNDGKSPAVARAKQWPVEKSPRRSDNKLEKEVKRHPKAEAQHERRSAVPATTGSAANRNRSANLVRTVFAFLVFACIV